MEHAQRIFTIPRILRRCIVRDRALLGCLSRAARETSRALMAEMNRPFKSLNGCHPAPIGSILARRAKRKAYSSAIRGGLRVSQDDR